MSQSYLVMENVNKNEKDSPVSIVIDGVLDLHTFRPKEVKDLVPEYIRECLKRDILDLRIIHGKGSGKLRETVHSILRREQAVRSFVQAPEDAGGWGATLVRLKKAP